MAVDLAKLVVSLEAESSQLRKELQKANRTLTKWERDVKRRMKSIGNAFKVGFGLAAAKVGIDSFGAILGRMFTASEDAARQMNKLNAILKTTGNVSGLTAKELDDFSRSLARSTLASTEGVRDAAAVLLTFKSIGGETFKETLKLAQDLSATFGGDLKSKAVQLGKALEDPVKGLSALAESGVSFTKVEADLIKSLVAAGKQLEAQSLIIKKVRDQVGGAGAAEAKGTLAGAVDSLGQSFDELFEKIGQTGIAKAAIAFIDALTVRIVNLGNLISQPDSERYLDLSDQRADIQKRLAAAQGGSGRMRGAIPGLKDDLAEVEAEMKRINDSTTQRLKYQAAATDAMNKNRLAAANAVGEVETQIINKLTKQKESFADLLKQAKDSINVKPVNPLIAGTLIEALNALSQAKTAESAGDTKGQLEAAKKSVELIQKLSEAGKLSKQYANTLLDQAGELGGNAADRMLELKLDDKTLEAEADRARKLIQSNFSATPFTAQIQWTTPGGPDNTLAKGATMPDGSPLIFNLPGGKSVEVTATGENVGDLRSALGAYIDKDGPKQ